MAGNKKISFDVEANTERAKNQLNNLKRDMDQLSKSDFNVKTNVEDNAVISPDTVSSKDFKELKDSIDRLVKSMSKSSSTVEPASKTVDSKSIPTTVLDPKTPKDDSAGKQIPESFFNRLVDKLKSPENLGMALGAGKFLYGYMKNGAGVAQDYNSQAMATYNRTGAYGNNFNRARTGAYGVGRTYGYSTGESINTQSEIMSGGFTNLTDLNADTKASMNLASAYGLDISTTSGTYASNVRRGFYNQGEGTDYASLISASIKANNMTGREDEQLRALNNIADFITNNKLVVTSDDFKNAAAMQAQITALLPELKGDRSAEFVSKLQGMMNPKNDKMLRLVGYGGSLGYGKEALYKANELIEAGVGNPETMKALKENIPNYVRDDIDLEFILRDLMGGGANLQDARLAKNYIFNQDTEGMKNLLDATGDSDLREKQARRQSSSTYTRDLYLNDKDNAQMGAGNALNTITSPLVDTYTKLPAPVQGIATGAIGMGAYGLMGRLGGSVISNIGKFLTGGSATGATTGAAESVAGSASGAKIFGDLAGGVASKVPTKGAIGAIASKIPEVSGQTLARAATGLTIGINAAKYGTEAYDNIQEGNYEGAAGSVGRGVGTVAGALGGAKLGALAGSAIMPGVGTAAGAVGGAVIGGLGSLIGGALGEGAGRGLFNLFKPSTAEASAEGNSLYTGDKRSLTARQESVVKREERLLDRLEDGSLFNINVDNKEESNKKEKKEDPKKLLSEFANMRNAFALGGGSMGMTGMSGTTGSTINSGPLTGNDNTQKIWNYFKGQGYSEAAIAGIMGNLSHESGLDPTKKQLGGGPGRGLAQWEGPRFTSLQNFAGARGKDWSDLQTQLDFMSHELANDYSESWLNNYKKSTDPAQAAIDFEKQYERAGIKSYDSRTSAAKQIYNNNYIGSKAIGLDRVSEDGYAYIHKDETILNRFEAREYRESNSPQGVSSGTSNINLNLNLSSADDNPKIQEMIIQAVKMAISQAGSGNNVKLNYGYSRAPR